MRKGVVFSVCCFFVFSLTTEGRSQGDAETTLARINALPAKERNEALLTEARREGAIEWYGSLQVGDVRDLIEKFKKRYPFIDIQYTRAGGTNVIGRVLTEHRAGVYKADVFGGRGNLHDTLMKAGLVAKNMTPVRKEIRDGFMDKGGYFLGPFTYSLVIGYNTRLVRPEKIPDSYQDLLAPEWKGQMTMDFEAYDWLAGMLDLLGEEKGADFARRMAAQNVRLQRGHTLLTQLMAAGEVRVMVDGYHYQLQNFKEKSAPVDFVIPDPMILKEPSGVWIARKAPHPHAAALLVDFLFSRDGQQVYIDQNRLVARKDMEWDFGGKKLKRVHVLSAEKWGPRYNDLAKQFDEIFRRQR